jgi:hypothetical protein
MDLIIFRSRIRIRMKIRIGSASKTKGGSGSASSYNSNPNCLFKGFWAVDDLGVIGTRGVEVEMGEGGGGGEDKTWLQRNVARFFYSLIYVPCVS